jgi:hypothetical protein
MKFLFVATMILGSFSSIASDYQKESFNCSISVAKSTINNASRAEIPLSKSFSVDVTYLDDGYPTWRLKKIVDYKVSGDLSHQDLTIKKNFGDLDESFAREPDMVVKLKSFSKEQARQLLEDLGENTIGNLPAGINFKNLRFGSGCNIYSGRFASSEKIIRFNKNIQDGLTYHFRLTCEKNSCR